MGKAIVKMAQMRLIAPSQPLPCRSHPPLKSSAQSWCSCVIMATVFPSGGGVMHLMIVVMPLMKMVVHLISSLPTLQHKDLKPQQFLTLVMRWVALYSLTSLTQHTWYQATCHPQKMLDDRNLPGNANIFAISELKPLYTCTVQSWTCHLSMFCGTSNFSGFSFQHNTSKSAAFAFLKLYTVDYPLPEYSCSLYRHSFLYFHK